MLNDREKYVLKYALENEIFIRSDRSLDISKFLDDNNQIDLWFFELTLRVITKIIYDISKITGKFYLLKLTGFDRYIEKRNISEEGFNEERMFILKFKEAVEMEDID